MTTYFREEEGMIVVIIRIETDSGREECGDDGTASESDIEVSRIDLNQNEQEMIMMRRRGPPR